MGVHSDQKQKEIDGSPKMLVREESRGLVRVDMEGDLREFCRATGSDAVAMGLLSQLAALGAPGKRCDAEASNFALGLIDALRPRDAAEVLLVAQMAALHQATMLLARRLNQSENVLQQESAGRALAKLARTYAAQMDTLKRNRSTGQQTVRVEHVTVQSGGQAVVGNVKTGGRAMNET